MKPGTPLPWHYEKRKERDRFGIPMSGYSLVDDEGTVISEAFPRPYLVAVNEDNAAYIVHAANMYPELVAALELAQELTTTARQYFPKSMHNGDKFSLETTCAAIGTALAKCGEE